MDTPAEEVALSEMFIASLVSNVSAHKERNLLPMVSYS